MDLVQLREKGLGARDLIGRGELLLRVCAAHGVPLVINDRPDIALAIGADGVHVGQDDVPPSVARRIMGPDALIGLSTQSDADLEESLQEPLDYISAGPVEPTPTKPGRPGTGTAHVRNARRRAGRPVFVTGGVKPQTIPGLVDAGADRFVVVRFLTESADPEKAARQLISAIDSSIDQSRSGS